MDCGKNRILETRHGRYVGTVEGSGVVSFKGIPFAKPPVGELRWMPPQKLDPGSLTMPADAYPPAPIQPDMPEPLAKRLGEATHRVQSEDCLYLNMWAWDLDTPKKAVLFWVYGGSFTIGDASRLQSRGERFVANHHDIVVVAPNYRLGVLGSLNLSALDEAGKYADSCNLNLLDQRAALEWVHENADAFGGDAGNITMYGHSAGSNSISHHLAIPESSKLIDKAICQSSFLVGHGTVSIDESLEFAKKFFDLLGVETLEDALAISAEALKGAQQKLCGLAYTPPVCDMRTVFPNELERLASGELKGKKILIGNSTGEFDQLFAGKTVEEARSLVMSRAEQRIGNDAKWVDGFCELHPEMGEVEALMTANNELCMTYGGELQARALAGSNEVRKFLFSWADPESGARAPHGAPCPFVFGNDIPFNAPADLYEKTQGVWASFIKSGEVEGEGVPAWPQYGRDGGFVMDIDEVWSLLDDPWKGDFAYWAPVYPEVDCVKGEGNE